MGKEEFSNKQIALCLSGGGLRATLFHLGVVKALRELRTASDEMALQSVEEVYAVSGGSILAAHMLVNWSRYTDPDEAAFAEVEKEIREFASWNIRDRIPRRWFLTRWVGGLVALASRIPVFGRIVGRRTGLFSRTYWLQRQYSSSKLIGKVGFGEVTAISKAQPKFHFLSTSFKTGELCSFSGDQFEIEAREDDPTIAQSKALPPASTPCGHLRLSFAVAASSAFPPMFPPIELTDDQLANPKGEEFLNSISLSDGGVYDNLGIEKFRRNMARNPNHPARLIISDAGGSFRASTEKSYGNLIARNVRASDILMHRVGDKLKADIGQLKSVDDVIIRISDTVPNSDVDEAIQQRLRLVRTDLDRFDTPLAELLIGHGVRLTKSKIEPLYPTNESGFLNTAPPTTKETEALDLKVKRAAERSFVSLFLDVRDLVWLLTCYVVFAVVCYLTYFGWSEYTTYKATMLAETLSATREDERAKTRTAVEPILFDVSSALESQNPQLARTHLNLALSALGSARQAEVRKSLPETGAPAIEPVQPTLRTQNVYIQFAGDLTRAEITSLNDGLRNAGWSAQGGSGERIATASGLNEVRYSGDNEQAARELADAINQSRLPLGEPVGIHKVGIIGPNALEVWISR